MRKLSILLAWRRLESARWIFPLPHYLHDDRSGRWPGTVSSGWCGGLYGRTNHIVSELVPSGEIRCEYGGFLHIPHYANDSSLNSVSLRLPSGGWRCFPWAFFVFVGVCVRLWYRFLGSGLWSHSICFFIYFPRHWR